MERIKKIKHLCFFVFATLIMLALEAFVGCNKDEPKPVEST